MCSDLAVITASDRRRSRPSARQLSRLFRSGGVAGDCQQLSWIGIGTEPAASQLTAPGGGDIWSSGTAAAGPTSALIHDGLRCSLWPGPLLTCDFSWLLPIVTSLTSESGGSAGQ